MKKEIIFMFSGQGSQFKDMGLRFYHSNQAYHDWMDRLDVLYKEYTKSSFFDALCGTNYQKNCTNLMYTHLGIFMVEYALAQAFIENGVSPQYVIGSSLGEYTAAGIAGGVSCEDLFDILYTQAYYVTQCCPKGKMITILANINLYQKNEELFKYSEIVSINFENHFTISVVQDNYEQVVEFLKANKVTYVVLPVDYPFHSSYVENIEEVFKRNIYVEEKPLNVPMCSSVTGKMVDHITTDYLWSCVHKQICFSDAIKDLVRGKDCILVDLGPGGTMSTISKYVLKGRKLETYEPLTMFSRNINLDDILKEIAEHREL